MYVVYVSASTHASPLFFTRPSPAQPYALSLHDALPIFGQRPLGLDERLLCAGDVVPLQVREARVGDRGPGVGAPLDRKSTRLNSSHLGISYAVFCLKNKKEMNKMVPSDLIVVHLKSPVV